MDYETFDADAENSREDYSDFVEWLSERTARQLRQAKNDPALQKQVLCLYYQRGYRANLTPSELHDFLGISTPSIFDMAGYTDEEGDGAMQIACTLTLTEIGQAAEIGQTAFSDAA